MTTYQLLLIPLLQGAAVSTGAALLRAQSASTGIALAIQGPFLLAIIGAAWALRRPGMRAFAVVYGLFSLASVCSAISLAATNAATNAGADVLRNVMLAVTMFLTAAGWASNAHALRALGGTATSRWPSVPRMMLTGVLVIIATFALRALPFTGVLATMRQSWGPRPLFLLIMLLSAIDSWRVSRTAPANRTALRLVAYSYAALVVRQLFGLYAAFAASLGQAVAPESIVFMQAATAALNGVTLLAALMLEERAAMDEQSQQIRASESRLSRGQRLESLGQMAGGIAHDFANVLMVIGAGVSYAREAAGSPDVDAHLAEAELAVDRATGLTRQLRVYAQQRPAESAEFVAEERIDALRPMLQRLAGDGVSTDIRRESDSPTTLSMDPSQFDQILLNLVVNARDAMPAGGTITIDASSTHLDDGPSNRDSTLRAGRHLYLRVSDTGVGIAEDAMPRIFDPFFTTKGDRGTGLGLATVSSVVRQANGHVAVTSRVGNGTVFEIWIPAQER